MTIQDESSLSYLLQETVVNPRHDNWLFYWLKNNPQSTITQLIGGACTVRDALRYELDKLRIGREQVIQQRMQHLIPESHFHWIEDSNRFLSWITSQTYNGYQLQKQFASDNPLNLSHKDLCIALIDSLHFDQSSKIFALATWLPIWQSRLNIGKQFLWIAGDGEAECSEIAYKEALKFRPFHQRSLNFQGFVPPQSQEDFLIIIDELEIAPQEAIAISKEAKSKLSQRKFRRKETKAQLNVHISTETITRLEKIAAKHSLSMAKVVELLINEEFSQDLYISQKKAAWLRGDVS